MDAQHSSANFNFLATHNLQLVRLGTLAERYFRDDPNTCLIKLRQFGEVLAQLVAARTGALSSVEESQSDLLRRFRKDGLVPNEALELFHHLRTVGNDATHGHGGTHAEALNALKVARSVGIWFHRTFGKAAGFKPGPFVPPPDPATATTQLQAELERLRQELQTTQSAAQRAHAEAEAQARSRETAEEQARREAADRALWEQLAQEEQTAKTALAAQLQALQQASQQAPAAERAEIIELGLVASQTLDLDEMATRAIIDRQLREQGWDADSAGLRYADGARPAKGKAMAIAEWPTDSGPADYALFIGQQCVGVIEAKRQRRNVSGAIDQAQRYAKGIRLPADAQARGGPWGDYRVPFVFATNGRPYLRQIETESGIWFRDVRRDTHHRRALAGWFTPDGLKAELEIDRVAAQAALQATPFNFGFPLRPYQQRAIERIEATLTTDQRQMLVAMATGTGKTKLAIALLYRLLTAKRFRRICFVVDRNALGEQTAGEFRTTKVVSAKTFAEIFDLKGLEDASVEAETKVHVCTIQGLVGRVLLPGEGKTAPPIDQYDLMVIDECHRGYLLDREMSDAELAFRDQTDYVSKYRQVLEHFDAVKIGLTATPALHTAQIFGDPIFTYSYREAVIDGYLIDHEPPIRIETRLSQNGIVFAKGEQVELLDTRTGQIDLAHMPDEVQFDVEVFNRKVITEPFVAAVAGELAKHIDPTLDGKTLIFAVNKGHADLIVKQMKAALQARYGEIEDQAVRRITGDTDQVGAVIRAYRNDDMPKIAVTVDLLTTGIDVPAITNLVFFRRVNSRILYEQMLGRATRQCPEIGKETFRVFDAVDLYPHLQELTQMRPVVVNTQVSLAQLFEELATIEAAEHRRAVQDQIIVKLRRRLKRLPGEARDRYEATAGETPEQTLQRLQTSPPTEVAEWAKARRGIGAILDWQAEGGGQLLPISHHNDEVVSVSRGYGTASKPEDFLDGFTAFIRGNLNQLAALIVVVQRPRDLTRAQLRELRLELDRQGYSEANLRRAWQDARNEDIAASIIGFIRQAAVGDPLIPYEERVKAAIKRILTSRSWSDPQRRWLQRIGEQLEREIVVDREAIDRPPFDAHGGYRRLNMVFDGKLDALLSDINEELWRKVS